MKTEISKNRYVVYTVTYESGKKKEKVTVTTEVAAKSKIEQLVKCGAANVTFKMEVK